MNDRPQFTLPKLLVPSVAWQKVTALVVLLLALRIGYSITMRFDSDEPQHLHVVWAWASGLLPYKDVFDNHAPLFQWLYFPLFRLIGERADIVIPMRWAVIPIYFLSLYLIFRAGRTVLSSSSAWWAAVFGCLLPPSFLTSVEFRPDDLWGALWFAVLAVLVEGRGSPRRAFAAGALLGLTFAVSMKTTLLLLAIGLAITTLLVLKCFDKSERIDRFLLLRACAAAGIGMILPPALVVSYFYAQGALPSLWYCVIQHNIVPGLKRWGDPHYMDPWILMLFAFLLIGAVAIHRQDLPVGIRNRRVILFLAPLFYVLVLYGIWPDITREDDIPLYPLLPLAGFILFRSVPLLGLRPLHKRVTDILPWIVVACQVGWLLTIKLPWKRENRRQMSTFSRILKLTKPGSFVMDAKAGAIFRPRPFYYVLETVTRARMRSNLIIDNIPERLIETKTTVADLHGLLRGSKSEAFVTDNYLPLTDTAEIRVAGKLLSSKPTAAGEVIRFAVAVPTRYTIMDQHNPAPGVLDGIPLDQPRELAPGEHSFSPYSLSSRLALVWAGAVEVGYLPETR
jgi:hypothetical protein